MIFPPTHSTDPNKAKGIKAVLTWSSLNMAFSPLPGRSAKEVQEEVCIQCMLQQTDPWASSWLYGTKISCSRDYWRCRSLFLLRHCDHCDYLLGWRKICQRHWIQFHTNQGKLVVLLGGSISGRTGITQDSIPGQEIQLKAVQITQTYTREHSYTFWLMYIDHTSYLHTTQMYHCHCKEMAPQ